MGKKNSSNGGVYADCWHIPGGGIEENETEIAALKREILEEVGITFLDAQLVDDFGSGESIKTLKTGEQVICQMKFHVYEVRLPTDALQTEVKLSDDLVETIWVEKENIWHYKLTPPSTDLFKRLDL